MEFGNVGIGTTSPKKKLDIVDTNQAINSDQGNLYVRTSNAQAIDIGGMIGLGGYGTGTTDTAFGTISGRKENGIDADYAGYLAFATGNSGSTKTEKMRITSSGNVGIGTTGPTVKLAVQGELFVNSSFGSLVVGSSYTTNGHQIMVFGTAGLDSGTVWTQVSDARFKNVQSELFGTALDKVNELRPISYTWNDLHRSKFGDDEGLNYGFIAQEVEAVIPEFITQDPEGYFYYNPSGIEAILTAAIQELDQRIADFEKENQGLKQRIAALEGKQ